MKTYHAIPLAMTMLLALCGASCCGYRELQIMRKYTTAEDGRHGGNPGEAFSAGRSGAGRIFIRTGAVRYLALICSPSPVAAINNRGVALALDGKHEAAGILFREAAVEDASSGAAHNNSAVIHELAGRRKEAFRVYTAACLLDPGNRKFRYNFNSYAGYREPRRDRSGEIPPEDLKEPER